MGKRIQKTNRHKKLKAVDPFYTGDRKVLIDKGLIMANQPPTQADIDNTSQKLPMKLRELLELKEKLKNNKDKKKRVKITNGPDDKGAEIPLRASAQLKKMDHETDEKFLNRVEREAATAIHRSQYETQFDVKLETNNDKVVIVKEKKMSERKRRSLDEHRERLKLRKNNAQMERLNKEVKIDKVKFGEVVHQPPTITSFPRKPKIDKSKYTIPVDKPGKNGITEKDRNDVIYRYRMMKSQGKFN